MLWQCLQKVFEFRHIIRTMMYKEIFTGLMVAMFLGAGLLVVEVGVGIPTLQRALAQQQDIVGTWNSVLGSTVFNNNGLFTITTNTGTHVNGFYTYDGSKLTMTYQSGGTNVYDISDFTGSSFTATNEGNGQVIHVTR
jgi:hypothetical protein